MNPALELAQIHVSDVSRQEKLNRLYLLKPHMKADLRLRLQWDYVRLSFEGEINLVRTNCLKAHPFVIQMQLKQVTFVNYFWEWDHLFVKCTKHLVKQLDNPALSEAWIQAKAHIEEKKPK